MIENYYTLMGWDPKTGKPLPKTLEKLGLEELINDV
jgi:aldehyde:ferredoxin oxidoreductase